MLDYYKNIMTIHNKSYDIYKSVVLVFYHL